MSTKSVPILLFDSFAEGRLGGNPTGVVLEADTLSEGEMRGVAAELNQPTTAFFLENGTRRVRFFTPTGEIGLCGHALLAAVTARCERMPELTLRGSTELALETQAGPMGVRVERTDGRVDAVWIRFAPPTFAPYDGDLRELSAWLGCGPDGIDTRLPVEIASTGLRHLLVPARNLRVLDALQPDRDGLTELSRRAGVETVTPFTVDTVDPANTVHSRDLCPAIGNLEESASGTTNVALAGYLLRHRLVRGPKRGGEIELIGEQGYQMGRPSRIRLRVSREGGRVRSILVGGSALCTLRGEMQLDGA